MRTRNSNFPNRGRSPNVVKPELRTIVEVAPMAERTMEELLRASTKGYGEAIVLPEINADHFEIKTNLLQLVQASPFHGKFSKTDERIDQACDQQTPLDDIVSLESVTPVPVNKRLE
ncbi:hypothetical protein Tco_0282024 [Tanacetum coccineum]